MPKKNKPYVLKRMPQVSSNPDENWIEPQRGPLH